MGLIRVLFQTPKSLLYLPQVKILEEKLFDATLSCLEKKGTYVSGESHRTPEKHISTEDLDSSKQKKARITETTIFLN